MILTSMFQKPNLVIHEQASGKRMDFHMTFEVQNRVQVRKGFPPKSKFLFELNRRTNEDLKDFNLRQRKWRAGQTIVPSDLTPFLCLLHSRLRWWTQIS